MSTLSPASSARPASAARPASSARQEDLAQRLALDYGHLDAPDLLRVMIRETFPGRIAVTTSFGCEAAVLLQLVAQVDPATPIMFIDTGLLFARTLNYRQMLINRLGLRDVRTVHPDPADVAAADPGDDLWQRDHDACCKLRKVSPLKGALEGFDAWITGRKRFHCDDRSGLPVIEAMDGRIKINPLASWSAERIEAAFHDKNLPQHPLCKQGFTSVGCYPCTSLPLPGQGPRSGRWAGSGKTECGIHRALS